MAYSFVLKNNSVKLHSTPAYLLSAIIAIVFLPFAQALTLDIGFPLKISEVLIFLSLVLFFADCMYIKTQIPLNATIYGIMFLIAALFSTVYSQLNSELAVNLDYRGGQGLDGAMRVIYLAFGFCAFLMLYAAGLRNSALISRAWLFGLLLAVLYHAYTVVSFISTGEALLLPGLERHQLGWVGNIQLPRSGTFKEGNFASIYYLASLVISIHFKSKIFAALSVCGLILTLSTSALAGLLIFAFTYFLFRYGVTFKSVRNIALSAVVALAAFIQLDIAAKFVLAAGVSGGVRLNVVMTGINMFLANPIFGVGLGGYGYYFALYEWDSDLSKLSVAAKQIPNNVYVELLSEVGLVGTTLFIIFLSVWIGKAWKIKQKNPEFISFALSAMVAFVAFPTFNVLYVWCFYGISLALMKNLLNPIAKG